MHMPYIRNEATSTVLLTLTYADQPSPSTGTLAPNTNLDHFGSEERQLTELEARLEHGPVFVLGKDDLAGRRAAQQKPFEFWLITDEGVLLKGEEEWKQHRARK